MSTLLAVIIVIALVFGVLCFEGWIFMLLANWVLSLFSVAFAFTFWQAFGVVLLLSFIGGFFKNSSSSKQWGAISTLFLLSLRRARSSHAEFLLYQTPHNLSREKCEKFCTNFHPEICAFYLLNFSVAVVYYNYRKGNEAKPLSECSWLVDLTKSVD